MAKSLEEIADLLKHTKFKRKWLGGVDEEDVWRKLGRLNAEYSDLIEECRRRNNELEEQWRRYTASLERRIKNSADTPQPPSEAPKQNDGSGTDI